MTENLGVIVYVSIVDHINKRPYPIIAPLYYTDIPRDVEDQIIEPIYENTDSHATGRTMLPISAMIDMRAKDVPFSFRNKEDIIEVKKYLDLYLTELWNMRDHPTAEAYLAKASKLQREISLSYRKLINRDSTKRTAYENEHRFINLITGHMSPDQIASRYDTSNN